MKYFLNKCGGLNMGEGVIWMKLKEHMLKGVPEFYREVLGAWKEFLTIVVYKPEGINEFLNHPLFLNFLIFYMKEMNYILNSGLQQG